MEGKEGHFKQFK